MGGEKKKCGGGFFKKLLISAIVLPLLAFGGWFAYAKATGDPVT